jgi:hypothetical protein
MTHGFDSGVTTATVTIVVNGVTSTFADSLGIRAEPSKITAIIPSSVSPVLKTPVKIILADYSDTLVKDDLEVIIVSKGAT